jgi:predicted RND superfamily exporter protein
VLYRVEMINIGLVLVCVFVFGTALFGSWLAGLMFVFSCVLANFTAFIYMYLFGIQLTIDTLPVISLAIGLGIDYGISTVSRIRAEVIAGHQLDDAIRVALKSAGESVLSTFCVMIGGILPWAFSPALFHHHMGVLLTILLATNVLAGVWILPATNGAPRRNSSAASRPPAPARWPVDAEMVFLPSFHITIMDVLAEMYWGMLGSRVALGSGACDFRIGGA